MNPADTKSLLEEQKYVGLRLAEDQDRVLYKNRDDDFVWRMGDLLESERFVEDEWLRANTALMLENMRKYFASMSETTRLVNVGDFEKYAFPMVTAIFPSLAAQEWASVQPMQGPVSLIFFMKFIYNATKGTAVAGQDIIENPNESYASDLVDAELLGSGDGATANYTGNLTYLPVRAGTVQITTVSGSSSLVVTDDGNGNLVGDVNGGGTNTIDYSTGAYDVTFSGNVDSTEEINAEYQYDLEGHATLPEIDLQLTSAPVTAVTRKLRTRWSVEAMQDLQALHGKSAEVEQLGAIAAEMKYEIDREVARDIKSVAANTVTAFSKTPSGVSYTEHKLLFVDKLIEASNLLFSSSQRAVGTWIFGGVNVASLLESLPGFQAAPKPKNTRGIYKSGRLNNQWDFWKDPAYPGATRNTTNSNGFTMGYKGVNMWEIGYVLAPYIMAFTTPTIQLDDMVGRKAIGSRYGKKVVDGKFFVNGSITGDAFA